MLYIPQMLAYIPYMDPMGLYMTGIIVQTIRISRCPSQAAATHVPASEGPNYAALAASGPFKKKKNNIIKMSNID